MSTTTDPLEWRNLHDRTWPQLRECTYLAYQALSKIGGSEAELALTYMRRILTNDGVRTSQQIRGDYQEGL